MLIQKNYLDFIFQCFFQGVLFTQFINVVVAFYNHQKRKDYLFYTAYLLTAIFYFLYKTIMAYKMGWKYGAYPFPHNGLNYILANVIHLTYLQFAQYFINTKEHYPRIHQLAQLTQKFICLFIALNVFTLVLYQSLLPVNVQYGYSAMLGAISMVLIGQMFRKRNRLVNYILVGSIAYVVGALLSLLTAVLHINGTLPNFEHSLLLTELGVLLEVLCFTAGLSYKSLVVEQDRAAAQQKLLRQMQENEKLKERLEDIKAKVTKELQDEMGATLTGISVYSDIGLKHNQQQNTQGVTAILEQIGKSARQMVNEVQDIVWMIQLQQHELDMLWQKAYQFAAEAVQGKNITLNFTISEEAKKLPLDLQVRKNIYLLTKECIHNAVKHADCKNIWVSLVLDNQKLILTIRDNGKGFVPENINTGNGLFNLRKRVRYCGGGLYIQSDATGSRFRFELKVEEKLLSGYY